MTVREPAVWTTTFEYSSYYKNTKSRRSGVSFPNYFWRTSAFIVLIHRVDTQLRDVVGDGGFKESIIKVIQ